MSARDLKRVLELAFEAGESEGIEDFYRRIAPGMQRLVPCDWLGYNAIDFARGTAVVVSDAPAFAGMERRFWETSDQHSLIARRRQGDLRTYMFSDFHSWREFHRLELYQDFYRPRGIEDQIAFGLPDRIMVSLALSRSRPGFTERDRELLELLRPHLAQAYLLARDRERATLLIGALDAGVEEQRTGVIQLDHFGRITRMSPAARELVETYFGRRVARRAHLPPTLAEWASTKPEPGELTVEAERGRLCVRSLRSTASDRWPVLLLEEHRVHPPRIEFLRGLGLSRRQAEVLQLLASGKGTREIAQELSITSATVSKHLEHIFERLGVRSRGEAIIRVLS